jgi:hypothetical protein
MGCRRLGPPALPSWYINFLPKEMKMKKLFAVLVVLVVVSSAVYSAGPFFGAKLGVGIGFHGNGEFMDDLIDKEKANARSHGDPLSVDEKSGASFVLSPYGGYYFTDKLAVQGEFNFMIGQKKTWKPSDARYSPKRTGKYSSLDIPVLIRFDFINKPALFGALAGPYLSFPLGDVELSQAGNRTYDADAKGITAGIALGVYGGYPIGPGRIIGDIRFIIDFNPLKAKNYGETIEVIKRRGLNITAGYEISLGK